MERLDLGDSLLPIKIFGKDIDLQRPTLSQVIDNEEKMKSAVNDSKKVADIMNGFVVSLGMPKDVADKMTTDHYSKLMEHLNGGKKN